MKIQIPKGEKGPRGFGYAEFGTRTALIKALELNNSQFNGRPLRISLPDESGKDSSDRRGGHDRPEGHSDRTDNDWRRGPAEDIPYKTPAPGMNRSEPNRGFGSERPGGFGNGEFQPAYDSKRGYDRTNRYGDSESGRGYGDSNRRDDYEQRGHDRTDFRSDNNRGYRREDRTTGGFDSAESIRRDPAAGKYSAEARSGNARRDDYNQSRPYVDRSEGSFRSDINRRNIERSPPAALGSNRSDAPYSDQRSEQVSQYSDERSSSSYLPPSMRQHDPDVDNSRQQRYEPREARHDAHPDYNQTRRSESESSAPAPQPEPPQPVSRPKLQLKPRSRPKEEILAPVEESKRASIFGGAKPVDTTKKELEIEEKLKAATIAPTGDAEGTPASPSADGSDGAPRPRRVSTGSNASSGSKPRKISESDSHRSTGGGSSYGRQVSHEDHPRYRDERHRDEGYGSGVRGRHDGGIRRPPPPFDDRRDRRDDGRRDDRRDHRMMSDNDRNRRTFNDRPQPFMNNNRRSENNNNGRSYGHERPGRDDRPPRVIERPRDRGADNSSSQHTFDSNKTDLQKMKAPVSISII